MRENPVKDIIRCDQWKVQERHLSAVGRGISAGQAPSTEAPWFSRLSDYELYIIIIIISLVPLEHT